MTTVVVLGAGFSRWAGNLPLVSELFDFEVNSRNPCEARRLERLRAAYMGWRAANPVETNEAFVAWAQSQSKGFDLARWYVTRRLTDPFVSNGHIRRTWYLNGARAHGSEGAQRAGAFLRSVRQRYGCPTILTANYDLLVEYALGSKGFNYGVVGEYIGRSPHPGLVPVYASGDVTLLKLHGSLSWSSDGQKTTALRPGLNGDCLIVPPMAEKAPNLTFANEWAQAAAALQRAERLIVFGFAFNPYDRAIRKLFSKNSTSVSEIISIDIADQRSRLAEVFDCENIDWMLPDQAVGI